MTSKPMTAVPVFAVDDTRYNDLPIGTQCDVIYPPRDFGEPTARNRFWRKVRLQVVWQAIRKGDTPCRCYTVLKRRRLSDEEIAYWAVEFERQFVERDYAWLLWLTRKQAHAAAWGLALDPGDVLAHSNYDEALATVERLHQRANAARVTAGG